MGCTVYKDIIMDIDTGYIYIGGYYHYHNKDISTLTEKKIGKSINVPSRETALNSTKFTIGYTMIKYWAVDSMSRVEKLLHNVLPERLNGEWFEDDGTLVERVSKFMDVYGAQEQRMETTELDTNARAMVTSYSGREQVANLAGQTFSYAKKALDGGEIKVSFVVNPDGTFYCPENGKTYENSPHSAFCELWHGKVVGEAKCNVWQAPRNSRGKSMDQELAILWVNQKIIQ